MFSYYGSKSKIVNLYPPPVYGKIIEPFAGSAQYSLRYFDREVTLVEKYDVIVRIWQWLQKCSPKDILGLPRLKFGETVDNYKWDCDEARWLVGMIITGGPTSPKKTASRWKTVVRPNTQNYKLKLISENLFKIKHWRIELGSYIDVPNSEATWFIDPPYQFGGEYYKYGNKDIDFRELSKWCRNRVGQVIVCENTKSDWMDFRAISKMRGSKFVTTEAMWTNMDTPIQEHFLV